MDPHGDYFRSLSRAEVHLLALREILYEGSWEEMVRDLESRKRGKPHVFKLQNRIEEDLERIQNLMDYEKQHNVNLGRYVAEALAEEKRVG